jgi:hypothetical protein
MSDVEKEMDALQRKLTAKTREIEALIAAEQNLGNLDAIDSADYARLQSLCREPYLPMAGSEGWFGWQC